MFFCMEGRRARPINSTSLTVKQSNSGLAGRVIGVLRRRVERLGRSRPSAAGVPLTCIRPSDHDPDRVSVIEAIALEPGDAPEVDAGRVRGLLLHKLMEEVLTGEFAEEVGQFASRVRELLTELVCDPADGGALPDADEIAATAWRTLQLPEVAPCGHGSFPNGRSTGWSRMEAAQRHSPDASTPSRRTSGSVGRSTHSSTAPTLAVPSCCSKAERRCQRPSV